MNRTSRFDSAHVIAAVALFVALGGTALAALERNSVTSKQIKNESVKGKDIRDGQVRGAEVAEETLSSVPDAQALGTLPASAFQRSVRWAVVDASATGATVVRGNATAAGRANMGQYFVSFAPDISGCAFIATNGAVGVASSPAGEVSVESASTQDPTTTVEVRYRNSAGSAADYTAGPDGFHVAVIC